MQAYFQLQTCGHVMQNNLSSCGTITILASPYTWRSVFLQTPHSNQQGCSCLAQLYRINHRWERRGGGELLCVQRKDLNLNNCVSGRGAFRHVSGNCLKVLKGSNNARGTVQDKWEKGRFCWCHLVKKKETPFQRNYWTKELPMFEKTLTNKFSHEYTICFHILLKSRWTFR